MNKTTESNRIKKLETALAVCVEIVRDKTTRPELRFDYVAGLAADVLGDAFPGAIDRQSAFEAFVCKVLNDECGGFTAHGVNHQASYEYPGFISIANWAFGTAGGDWGGNHSDGVIGEGLKVGGIGCRDAHKIACEICRVLEKHADTLPRPDLGKPAETAPACMAWGNRHAGAVTSLVCPECGTILGGAK